MTTMTKEDLRIAFGELNARYCRTIDTDKLEDWPLYFTEDARYEINTRENQLRGIPLGAMYCDSRGMLHDRVTAIRKVLVFEPHNYRHITSGAVIDTDASSERFTVQSNFVVYRISAASGDTIVFASGVYEDEIVMGANGPLFARRLVIIDSNRLQTGLVIPL